MFFKPSRGDVACKAKLVLGIAEPAAALDAIPVYLLMPLVPLNNRCKPKGPCNCPSDVSSSPLAGLGVGT